MILDSHLDTAATTDQLPGIPKISQLPPSAAAAGIPSSSGGGSSSRKIAFVTEAVRLFGGVIIGSAAGNISRNFRCYQSGSPNPPSDESDEGEGLDSETLAVTFGTDRQPIGISPSLENKRGSFRTGSSGDVHEVNNEGTMMPLPLHNEKPISGLLGVKRPVAAAAAAGAVGATQPQPSKKRRPTGTEALESGGSVDATPIAPAAGGAAAARAKAEGMGRTSFVSECRLPTDKGEFRLRAYRYAGKDKTHEPVVMVAGDVRGKANVPVRVHDQCQTSEVLGSRRCDCREQLDLSLKYIQGKRGGAVIYLQQEGRGIGLANKIAAYALQDGGLDTVDANRQLGFDDDQRSYECVSFILRDMGVKSIRLMTNNPFKINWMKATGIEVSGRIPVQVASNKHNVGYLEAKADRMSHLINNL